MIETTNIYIKYREDEVEQAIEQADNKKQEGYEIIPEFSHRFGEGLEDPEGYIGVLGLHKITMPEQRSKGD